MVNKKKEVCPLCIVYKERKREFLEENPSIFDTIQDINSFLEECSLSCREFKVKTYSSSDEDPNCQKCDYCPGGGNFCEYCGPGTSYPHYKRTEVIGKSKA